MRCVEVDGFRASVIGLGTWQFGSREWGYGKAYADTVAPALVRRAIGLGITFIDTAEVYGLGRSERIVGSALAGPRDDVIVATKLLPLLPLPAITVARGRDSRTRLGVDAIDLYQLHFPLTDATCALATSGSWRNVRPWTVRAGSRPSTAFIGRSQPPSERSPVRAGWSCSIAAVTIPRGKNCRVLALGGRGRRSVNNVLGQHI